MDLKNYVRSIKDYPKKGILFRDITTLIKDQNAFCECINQLTEKSKKYNFDKIAAIESRGFVFASVLAYLLNKPLIMVRKKINYLLKNFQWILIWNMEVLLLKSIKIGF